MCCTLDIVACVPTGAVNLLCSGSELTSWLGSGVSETVPTGRGPHGSP